MSSNSPMGGLGGIARPADFVGAQARGDLLEHAVHEAIAFRAAVALAQLDGLVQHHPERRFRMRGELERADIEDRALDRREAREIAVEVRHDQALQLADAVAYARHQRLDEEPVALLEAVQAARLLHRIAARELPGIERLQREFARLAPSAFFHQRPAAIWPSRAPRAPPRRPCRA